MAIVPSRELRSDAFRAQIHQGPQREGDSRLNSSVNALGGEARKHAAWGVAFDGTPRSARLLSYAQQVRALTNNPEIRGASADLFSMKPYEPGSKKYLVGGEQDVRTGQAFPTQLVDVGAKDAKLTMHDVISTRENMLPAAKGRAQPVYGTWKSYDKPQVDVDLSTAFNNRGKAKSMTIKRNEDAMFDMEVMDEVTQDQIRAESPKRYNKPRPPKTAKQEVVHRYAD